MIVVRCLVMFPKPFRSLNVAVGILLMAVKQEQGAAPLPYTGLAPVIDWAFCDINGLGFCYLCVRGRVTIVDRKFRCVRQSVFFDAYGACYFLVFIAHPLVDVDFVIKTISA